MPLRKHYLLGGYRYCRLFDVFVEFSANSETTKKHWLHPVLPISIHLACVCVCVLKWNIDVPFAGSCENQGEWRSGRLTREWKEMERQIETRRLNSELWKWLCECRNTLRLCGRSAGARNTEMECDTGRNWNWKDDKIAREGVDIKKVSVEKEGGEQEMGRACWCLMEGERQSETTEEWSAGGYEYPLFTHVWSIRGFTPTVARTVKMQHHMHPAWNVLRKPRSRFFFFFLFFWFIKIWFNRVFHSEKKSVFFFRQKTNTCIVLI